MTQLDDFFQSLINESQFFEAVTKKLRDAGLQFQLQPSIAGLQPDFVVTTPAGDTVVLDLKMRTDPKSAANAVRQVKRYADAVGAARAFVVIPDQKNSRSGPDIVHLRDLVPRLVATTATKGAPRQRKRPQPGPTNRTIFAAMPFDPAYEDVFFVAMAPAAETVGAVCQRVDRDEFAGDIVSRLEFLIRESTMVVADLSEGRPNVLYEVGYAQALEKPVVHISSTPLNDLPFDVGHRNTLMYTKGQTHALRDKLKKRFRALLS